MSKTAKEIILSIPSRVPADKIGNAETCFHLSISGEGGGHFTVSAKDGKVEAVEGFEGEAKCTMSCTAVLFHELLAGKANPMMAVFTGKLKISNKSEVMKYAQLFGIM
jgi:putative sterol carrier protein